MDVQRFFGLYQEHRIQQAFLDWTPFISFWNIYYGTIHFVMPVIALVALYRKTPARYVRWRNTLLFMLAFGLVGFWLYPLTPPRLMPAHYDFVDTAAEFFNFGPQQRIALDASGEPTAAAKAAFGNLYAAMPSLHVGWSTWSALALLPLVRRRWLKVLLVLLPARDDLRDRRDREPLDPRRGRRLGRARRRVRLRDSARARAQSSFTIVTVPVPSPIVRLTGDESVTLKVSLPSTNCSAVR